MEVIKLPFPVIGDCTGMEMFFNFFGKEVDFGELSEKEEVLKRDWMGEYYCSYISAVPVPTEMVDRLGLRSRRDELIWRETLSSLVNKCNRFSLQDYKEIQCAVETYLTIWEKALFTGDVVIYETSKRKHASKPVANLTLVQCSK